MTNEESKQILRQYLNLVRRVACRPEIQLNHDTIWVKTHLKQANQLRATLGKAILTPMEFRDAVACMRQLEGL